MFTGIFRKTIGLILISLRYRCNYIFITSFLGLDNVSSSFINNITVFRGFYVEEEIIMKIIVYKPGRFLRLVFKTIFKV
jgi:hypothetical protein